MAFRIKVIDTNFDEFEVMINDFDSIQVDMSCSGVYRPIGDMLAPYDDIESDKEASYDDGYEEGHDAGYDAGYEDGYAKGHAEGSGDE